MEELSNSHLDPELAENSTVSGEIKAENDISEVKSRIGDESDPIRSSPVSPKVNGDQALEEDPVAPVVNGDGIVSVSTVSAKKGCGLKKWRRIRRDVSKEGNSVVDASVVHKRRLPANEPKKAREENKIENDINLDLDIEPVVPYVESPRSIEAVDATHFDPDLVNLVTRFSIGIDSDNSEERSSKSSTAASVPKLRHEIGFGRERARGKNLGGRGRGGGIDVSKKVRGDRINIEKESSLSSVESSVGFLKKTTRVTNGNGEHSDEAQMSGYYKENGGVEDLSREDFDVDVSEGKRNGESKKYHPNSGIDPFVESIMLLETTQEALETEIKKFEEIEEEADVDISHSNSEETEVTSFPATETNFLELKQKLQTLETIINGTQDTCKDLELELETLLKKKLEAEIEFLIISRTNQNWKISTEDQHAILNEQKSLSQMVSKMKETESKLMKVKKRADELDDNCKVMLQDQEALTIQNSVCKYSMCFFLQLILLCLAFGLFLLQLLPLSQDFVPT